MKSSSLLLACVATLALSGAATGSAAAAEPKAGASKTGASKTGASKTSTDKKGPGWETKLYAQPRVGAFVFSNGNSTSTGASIGAEAGLRYWQVRKPYPVIRGVARVAGDYVLTTSSASGMEFRVGNFLGPYWKNVGLQAGPDVFWNKYSFSGTDLDPTVGVAVPITALTWTTKRTLSGYVGVEPSWLSNPDRRVDWSEQDMFGFGHEFAYKAGVGLSVDSLAVSVGYVYKITAYGTQHGLSAGIGL